MTPAEREREQFEALITAYRQLPTAEPSPELDRLVLAAARAAISPERTQRPRWPALLATAATFTLAIGLAWQVREDNYRTQAPVGEPAPVALPVPSREEDLESPGRADARSTVTDSTAAQTAQQVAESTEPTKSESATSEKAHDTPAISAPSGAAAPKPPASPAMENRRDNEAYRAGESQEELAAPEPAPLLEQESAVAMPLPDAEPKAFPLEAPAPMTPAPPPAAPAPPAPPRAVRPSAQAPTEASGVLHKRVARDFDASDPAAWLEDIRRLLRLGERERARNRLEEFREVFPDAQIPEDLRELGR